MNSLLHYHINSKIFSNPKFIFIFRNGIDVVESRIKYMGESFIESCQMYAETVSGHLDIISQTSDNLIVFQEKLISCPQSVFTQIYEFLGIQFCQASVDYVKNVIIHPTRNGQQNKKGYLK